MISSPLSQSKVRKENDFGLVDVFLLIVFFKKKTKQKAHESITCILFFMTGRMISAD